MIYFCYLKGDIFESGWKEVMFVAILELNKSPRIDCAILRIKIIYYA